ncbi:MAG: hypothetical protein ACRCXX_14355 [Cetobacterium sp.]|uniref:hypothetical protein n=1 Tax=Cetobacterium sp. TaxID=2071632 RepID=UPI003F2B150E
MATETWRYNNVMARLRVARDKYFGGWGVGADVGHGTRMTVGQMNDCAYWCTEVTNRSPIRHTYNTVGSGEKVTAWKLDDNYNKINAVSVCYSNCHSNCHNNCDCAGHSCADGR